MDDSDAALVAILAAMPQELLRRQTMVQGRVLGAQPGAGYSVALQGHLDNAQNALQAAAATKTAHDMDGEERAVNIGVSHALVAPEPLVEAGVGWWKDHLGEIKACLDRNLQVWASFDFVESLVKAALQERTLVGVQLIGAEVFCVDLRNTISQLTVKNIGARTHLIICVLEVVLGAVLAHRGDEWEVHMKAVTGGDGQYNGPVYSQYILRSGYAQYIS
ncbi:hypothetical protein FB451DRAFT_1176471 [Mycena latifolia]|nr:hypothetical protein FB451DRAFT_1176471 [Mycena latifolia]